MGSPGGGVDSGGGPGGNDGPGGSDNGGRGSDEDSRTSSKSESSQARMTGSERTQEAEAANETNFSESLAEAKEEADRSKSPNDDSGNSPSNANGATPSPSETPDSTEPEEEGGGVFDRAGDFFGGLAQDMQDFARENPRVDSHGDTVGLVDSDGIQRGEVASRVRSSGTSSEDLANQLGFSSPQDMAAAQNTDFIGDKYQDDLANRAMVEAIENRYGPVPAHAEAYRGAPEAGILQASSTAPAVGVAVTSLADDIAKYGLRTVTKALGPLGILIDVMTPTPVADGTLKSEETTTSKSEGQGSIEDLRDGERTTVPVGDLEPLHDAETSGKRPELEGLSDDELVDSIENPKNGDSVKVNTETGKVVDGNGRVRELQERAKDPNSSITPETEITVEGHTPDNTVFDWEN